MTKPIAELTDAELETARADANAACHCADYVESYREWRAAADQADGHLASVTAEITRRDRIRLENPHGKR